jgi:succinyl-CoA synthetase beta subunit
MYMTRQVEINPLVETPDGRVVCFDAKIAFDDNGWFAHGVAVLLSLFCFKHNLRLLL